VSVRTLSPTTPRACATRHRPGRIAAAARLAGAGIPRRWPAAARGARPRRVAAGILPAGTHRSWMVATRGDVSRVGTVCGAVPTRSTACAAAHRRPSKIERRGRCPTPPLGCPAVAEQGRRRGPAQRREGNRWERGRGRGGVVGGHGLASKNAIVKPAGVTLRSCERSADGGMWCIGLGLRGSTGALAGSTKLPHRHVRLVHGSP